MIRSCHNEIRSLYPIRLFISRRTPLDENVQIPACLCVAVSDVNPMHGGHEKGHEYNE